MLPSSSGILAEAINTMHLICIEQNEEENTLRIDPSNNQSNFNKWFKSSFIFTSLTYTDANWLQDSKLSCTLSNLPSSVNSMKTKTN